MSKIGKEPIKFDSSKVNITVEKGGEFDHLSVTVKGPKGELLQDIRRGIEVSVEDGQVTVTRKNDNYSAFHGLYRMLIKNMIQGVMEGYEKKLEIHGVGYRGTVNGNNVELSLGFSHKVNYEAPEGISITMPDETSITITGIDKQKVGQVAAEIRALRKPEPYKGKGVRYAGEQVRRKAGKSASA